jgi:hypothetical protein
MNLGKDFDRLYIASQTRYALIDDFTPPSKRTIQQKFQIQAMRAANKLVDLKMMMPEAANLFLEKFAIPVSSNPGTMNGAAFALVFCCFDFMNNEFIMKDDADTLSWKTIQENISHPSHGFEEFVKEYGITINDLIRYFIFSENYLESALVNT